MARRLAEEEERQRVEEEAALAVQARVQAEQERFEAEERARMKAEAEASAKQQAEALAAAAEEEEEARIMAEIEAQRVLSLEVMVEEVVSTETELQSVDASDREFTNEVSIQTAELEFKKPLILAVDDSPTVRKLVALTLSSQGFEVITAADGIEALTILSEQLPDLILSDINMPKLNGYKLCKFVKKHERTQSIPVVMLSGKDGVFDKMRGKMNGCNDFIAKPFESAELVAKVRQNLHAVNSH